MVTISDSQCEPLRLRLVGRCQYDVVQYDVVTVATLPHTVVVSNHLILIGGQHHRLDILQGTSDQGNKVVVFITSLSGNYNVFFML